MTQHNDMIRLRHMLDHAKEAVALIAGKDRAEEVQPGVILDYDEHDQVVGVEFFGISSRATKEELSSIQFQTA